MNQSAPSTSLPLQTAAPKPVRHNRTTARWLPWLGAILLVALIVAGLWPKPVPIEIALVQEGALRAAVNEEGKTRIKQRFLVSAPVAGQLRRIPFKAGAEVKAGETVLAVIEPISPALLDARTRRLTEARRDAAAANLAKAKATRTFAENELRRFEKLYSEQAISIQERDTAKLREESAVKEESAADSALRQAEAELAQFTTDTPGNTSTATTPIEVKSPASGRVLKVLEENARVVGPGTPLLELGDPADLEIVIDTLSRDGAAIRPGNRVEFQHWGGPDALEGRVRLVEPAAFTKISALGVEEQRVNVIADLVTPPEKRPTLGDNFRVEASIITWESEKVLKAPSGALFRQGDRWATFVVVDGRARLRLVQAGRTSGTEIQILEGLHPGDQVILYPGSRVKDGDRVKPIVV
jgi:HlyD family secretion protein